MSGTRMFRIWSNMRQRCSNPKNTGYRYYGGKGIKVSKRWLKFENFYKDMKHGYADNLSLDRINGNGNYCKGNCRWSDIKTQLNNRCNCIKIKNGRDIFSLLDIANKHSINITTLRERYKKGLKSYNQLVKKYRPYEIRYLLASLNK